MLSNLNNEDSKLGLVSNKISNKNLNFNNINQKNDIFINKTELNAFRKMNNKNNLLNISQSQDSLIVGKDSNKNHIKKNEDMINKVNENNHISNRKLVRKSHVITFSSDEELKEDLKFHAFLINHDSNWKQYFDMYILILTLYSSIIIPYKFSYYNRDSLFSEESQLSNYIIENKTVFLIDILIDISFMIDLIFRFFTTYLDNHQIKVINIYDISKNYLFSWFIIDFIGLVPLEYLIKFTNTGNNLIFFKKNRLSLTTRLIKYNKIFRIFKLFNKNQSKVMNNILKSTSIKLNTLIVFLIELTIFLHFSSCLWKLIAFYEDETNNWITFFEFSYLNEFEIYFESLFFIISTITTVGYGNIFPVNEVERVFTCILILFSVYIYSLAVGKLTNTFEVTSEKLKISKEKMRIFLKISKDYKLSNEFSNAIKQHILNSTKESPHLEIVKFVNKFHDLISNNIINYVLNKQILSLNFFKGKSREFICYVTRKLRLSNHIKDEYICKFSQYINESKYN